MKKQIFTRLDKRHTGHHDWKYFVSRRTGEYNKKFISLHAGTQLFHMWRAWCWETWGPSKELEDWSEDARNPLLLPVCHNEHWCWNNDNFNTRIYLRTDKELSMFLLKWT